MSTAPTCDVHKGRAGRVVGLSMVVCDWCDAGHPADYDPADEKTLEALRSNAPIDFDTDEVTQEIVWPDYICAIEAISIERLGPDGTYITLYPGTTAIGGVHMRVTKVVITRANGVAYVHNLPAPGPVSIQPNGDIVVRYFRP